MAENIFYANQLKIRTRIYSGKYALIHTKTKKPKAIGKNTEK